MNKLSKLFLIIVGCELVGLLGAIFTFSSIPTWYATLNKPIFAPPNYVFGPIWTTLYLLMGIAFFIIWEYKGKVSTKKAKYYFYIQLILNFAWSPAFFGLKSLALGLVIIVPMLFFIYKTIREFEKINKLAAFLMTPYLAWVSVATILNFAVLILN